MITDLEQTYKEIGEDSFRAQLRGDNSSLRFDQATIAHVVGLAEQGHLRPPGWEIHKPESGGLLVIHQRFLAIQDQFPDLLPGGRWGSDACRQLLLETMELFTPLREHHLTVFESALNALEKDNHELAEELRQTWATGSGFNTYEEAKNHFLTNNVLVCLPWESEDATVWNDWLEIPYDLRDNLNPWKKANEIGLLFASLLQRGTKVPSHDYFDWAAARARQLGISLKEIYQSTRRHEVGGHGPIDAVLSQILEIPTTFIQEGFASAFSGEGKENLHLDPQIEEVSPEALNFSVAKLANQDDLTDPTEKQLLIYYGGARFFAAISKLLPQTKDLPHWPDNVAKMFLAAKTTAKEKLPDTNSKLHRFTYLLLDHLQLTEAQVDEVMRSYE